MQRQSTNRELGYSLLAVCFATLAYLVVMAWQGDIPGASDFYGHSIGVLGFVMMLMTESLYSLRKRSQTARWGRMADWLDFHIFTGIVGPYLVLLHSSWKFNGLAGVLMLLTVIVVLSGFIGRYIYTSIPRTAEGVEVEASQLEQQIALADRELKAWLTSPDTALRNLARNFYGAPLGSAGQLSLVLSRGFYDARYQLRWWMQRRRLDASSKVKVKHLESLLNQRRVLEIQLASLTTARRMLALWHAVHIPIGMVLFTTAIIHIIAAIYYATLLR